VKNRIVCLPTGYGKVEDFHEILPYVKGSSDEDVVILITPLKRRYEQSFVMTQKISAISGTGKNIRFECGHFTYFELSRADTTKKS
jgi:hypothetical protein